MASLTEEKKQSKVNMQMKLCKIGIVDYCDMLNYTSVKISRYVSTDSFEVWIDYICVTHLDVLQNTTI